MQIFSKLTVQEINAPAFASKSVSIVFPTGSFLIDDNAKYIIDRDVVPTLKAFGSARVRIEGNTDNVGGHQGNVILSGKRAHSATVYLTQQYGFDVNRFIEVGNGPDKPIGDNSTEVGKAQNRRTEFQLLN